MAAPIVRRLRLAISNALAANNLLCGYSTDYGRLAPLFMGVRSYSMPVLSVELNPLHESAGRGTLAATVRRVRRSLLAETRRHVYDPTSHESQRATEVNWAGRFSEPDFLARIYDMEALHRDRGERGLEYNPLDRGARATGLRGWLGAPATRSGPDPGNAGEGSGHEFAYG